MITKEQIKNIKTFNISSLSEGLRQAEQRLNDSLTKKENIDKKSFTLLSIFLTFSTVLFTVAKLLISQQTTIFWSAIFAGVLFLAGTLLLFWSLRAMDYGTIGRYPDTWLQEGILDGDDDMRSYVLANILFDYQKSIAVSDESNNKKIRIVDVGIILGIIAPVLFLISLFVK